jgi:ABC-type polysaccharide/polyol phosphate transport system ATPase subunit
VRASKLSVDISVNMHVVSYNKTSGEGRQMVKPAALHIAGLSKRYGATQALTDVALSIASGEVRAILGENGAGKSTLVKVLSGVVAP